MLLHSGFCICWTETYFSFAIQDNPVNCRYLAEKVAGLSGKITVDPVYRVYLINCRTLSTYRRLLSNLFSNLTENNPTPNERQQIDPNNLDLINEIQLACERKPPQVSSHESQAKA